MAWIFNINISFFTISHIKNLFWSKSCDQWHVSTIQAFTLTSFSEGKTCNEKMGRQRFYLKLFLMKKNDIPAHEFSPLNEISYKKVHRTYTYAAQNCLHIATISAFPPSGLDRDSWAHQ